MKNAKISEMIHKVINLKVEYAKEPAGIEKKTPGLSWQNASEARSWTQSAYQIAVFSNAEDLSNDSGAVWDSGKVISNKSINILYEGKRLESGRSYYWRVRTWDKEDRPSGYSEPGLWEMGLMNLEDWKAKWIGMPEESQTIPVFRHGFHIRKDIRRARIYVCGLGHYELFLNGEKAGDCVLDPGWTNYSRSCLYSIYDVSDLIRQGQNALGIMLGNGMFNVVKGQRYVKYEGSFGKPRFILQLHLEYMDGTSGYVLSGENWKMAPGPITFSCTYGGEDYDAGREIKGWSYADFKEDDMWKAAILVSSPGGRLKWQSNPPVKVMKSFEPVSVKQPKPGVYIYDFGQNFSGWVKIAVKGSNGARIRLTPAEILTKDGLACQKHTGDPHYYIYTLKGGSTESWSPRFTYYGFRYMQVEGAVPEFESTDENPDKKPVIKRFEGQMLYPDVQTAGEFQCSDTMFNKIHEIINMAILSNMKSILTDCPHREKLGWMEQTHLIGPAIMYNYDVHSLYEKIMEDIREAQLDNGLVPDTVPEYVVFKSNEGYRDSPEWGSASIINPWYMYKKYGDLEILRNYYDIMCKYLDYLASRATHNVLHHGLGDWLDVGPNPPFSQNTPNSVTATAIYYYDISILEKVARLLEKEEDAKRFSELGEQVKNAFNIEFFDNQTFRYSNGSQTSNGMALYMELAEEAYREKVLNMLIKDIRVRGDHTTAGDVGHPYVLAALAKYGRPDVISDMLEKEDHPSYGYQVKNGATALCEEWDGPDPEGPHGSQNHLMLGSADEWFYSELAGIRTIRSGNELDLITIKPYFAEHVEWVKTYHEHPYGRIGVVWKKTGIKDNIELEVTLPANTRGIIKLPCRYTGNITEDGKPLGLTGDVKISGEQEGCVVLNAGSGKYTFAMGNV